MNADEALRLIEERIRASGKKPLNDLQRTIFRGAWIGKDYKEIHQDCDQVGLDHLMRNVGPRLWRLLGDIVSDELGERVEVRKESLRGPIERLSDRRSPLVVVSEQPTPSTVAWLQGDLPPADDLNNFDAWALKTCNRKQSWGQAPDAALFQGRAAAIATLSQWVEEDACRLIALVGTAGIGKTDLSVKLAEHLRERFEILVWRSLDPAITGQPPPPLKDLLADLMRCLADDSFSPDLAGLIDCLRHHRCLVVLDGFEAVLQNTVLSGDYSPGYENYADLLKRVSDTHHSSCLIITSQEKPREIEAREGDRAPTRSYGVPGLDPQDVENLFMAKGSFLATDADWRSLTLQYDGNPRFLQQIATTVINAFGRDLSRFLNYRPDSALFVGEIRRSLEQQLSRLSYAEMNLIRELARNRETMTLEEIQQLVQTSMSSHHLLEVLLSLVRRSLLTSSAISYSLHPLVMKYLTDG